MKRNNIMARNLSPDNDSMGSGYGDILAMMEKAHAAGTKPDAFKRDLTKMFSQDPNDTENFVFNSKGKTVFISAPDMMTLVAKFSLAYAKQYIILTNPIVSVNGTLVNKKKNFVWTLDSALVKLVGLNIRSQTKDNFNPISFVNATPDSYGVVPQHCMGWMIQGQLVGQTLQTGRIQVTTVSNIVRGKVETLQYTAGVWNSAGSTFAQAGVQKETWDLIINPTDVMGNQSLFFVPNFCPQLTVDFGGDPTIQVSSDFREILLDLERDQSFAETGYNSLIKVNANLPAGLQDVGIPGVVKITNQADYDAFVSAVPEFGAGITITPSQFVNLYIIPVTSASFFSKIFSALGAKDLITAATYEAAVRNMLLEVYSSPMGNAQN